MTNEGEKLQENFTCCYAITDVIAIKLQFTESQQNPFILCTIIIITILDF